jgi:hypothetical protein
MLVATRSGPSRSALAHTGAPAAARTAFVPSARNIVLLPDMFDPVMTNARPLEAKRKSLPTRCLSSMRG